jgi:hypothetical protein
VPRTLLRRTPLAITLVVGAAAWLIPVRAAESGAAPGAAAWLAAVLAGVALAAALMPPARRAARALAGAATPGALENALLALAGATGAGLGAALFANAAGRSLPVEFARDVALAMFATAPVAVLATARARATAGPARIPAAEAEAEKARRGSTRRNFLKVGAGGVATAAVVRLAPVAAAAPPAFHLTITEGDIEMIDGVPVWFRAFGGTDGRPQVPGPFLGNPGPFESNPEIRSGQKVHVTVTNLTPRDHTFLIERTGNEAPTDPVVGPVLIPKGGIPVEIDFTAPAAGTYIYRDADRNNRVLGMHGVLIVMPADGTNRPFPLGPGRLELPSEFLAQHTWVLHDIDPLLGELAKSQPTVSNLNYPLEKLTPRYFTVNGKSGIEATESLATVPVLPVQDPGANEVGVLIRVVNTGVATHSPHWHGNHIFPVDRNSVPNPPGVVYERDMVVMPALHRVNVLLPVHPGLDAWPPLDPVKGFEEQIFPMHCHAEMSQTAAGGLYPMGMLTDWRLVAKRQDVAAARARVVNGGRTRSVKAAIAATIRQR